MKTYSRCLTVPRALLPIVLAAFVATPLSAQETRDDLTLRDWSAAVWQSAMNGDKAGFEAFLASVPEDQGNNGLARLREGAVTYQNNREVAAEERETARQEALVELRAHLETGEISQALRSAVVYQTLSPSYDEALKAPELMQVIDEAVREIPAAEKNGDWLTAQELLFRLRTLFDDTSSRSAYNEYDKRLKAANRRLTLLASYAPRRLYELRNEQAVRMGEEPLPAFNDNGLEGWEDRLRGIESKMLVSALHYTATYHIEAEGADGWRPMLHGGLEALRTLAATPALREAFPGLRDEAAVARWVEHCDDRLTALRRTPDASLNRLVLIEIQSDLKKLNAQTIGLPNEVLLHEFGDGAMYDLSIAKEDDYTEIIWPYKLRRFRQSTDGKFVGVGILISYNDKREIVVVNPLEGTPAFFAGVLPGDRIIQVTDRDGDSSTVGWTLSDAVDRITGPRGSDVTLGIRREGVDETINYDIKRDTIKLRSVNGWYKRGLNEEGEPEWDWFIDPVNRIAYLRLTGFSEDSYDDMLEAWDEMNRDGDVRGLILDLRHNPGGLLDSARDIANLFVPEGEIVSVEDKDRRAVETLRASRNRAAIAAAGVPTVVLVNRGSASASEIVAGSLQAHDAAVIVGKRTWGKGSVQRVYGITANAQLKVTTQYYRLPPSAEDAEGRLVHKRPYAEEWGVDPDIEVDMTPQQILAAINLRSSADRISNVKPAADGEVEERPSPTELITQGVDPQLETALLILQAKSLAQARGEQASRN